MTRIDCVANNGLCVANVGLSNSMEAELETGDAAVARLAPADVPALLAPLGFPDVDARDVTRLGGGDVNATFRVRRRGVGVGAKLGDELVVKVNPRRREQLFLPNVDLCEQLAHEPTGEQVVRVLAYDCRVRTAHEVLVMRRADGSTLLHDMLTAPSGELEAVLRQVCRLLKRFGDIHYESFGFFGAGEILGGGDRRVREYDTCAEFLLSGCILPNLIELLRRGDCDSDAYEQIERHVRQYAHVFDAGDARPSFVHTDVHWANILHVGGRLSALIDFDFSVKGAQCQVLPMLLEAIAHPEIIAPQSDASEDRELRAKLATLDLSWAVRVLCDELPDLFADPHLYRKLNLLYIKELLWMAAHCPHGNGNELQQVLERELLPDEQLIDTHYAKILTAKTRRTAPVTCPTAQSI